MIERPLRMQVKFSSGIRFALLGQADVRFLEEGTSEHWLVKWIIGRRFKF
jgi:hypothetical protein